MDRILSLFLGHKIIPETRLKPAELVKFEFKLGRAKSGKLDVLLCPWRTHILWFTPIKWWLYFKGDSYLFCDFPIQILSTDPTETTEYFPEIKRIITAKIRELKLEHEFEQVTLVGMSLSVVISLMIANGNPDIDKMVSVAMGYDLADSLWHGIQTRDLKNTYIHRGYTLERLMREWGAISPHNNISRLSVKEHIILVSKSDDIVPYQGGKRMLDEMQTLGLKPKILSNTMLGHYLTILRFSLFPKPLL